MSYNQIVTFIKKIKNKVIIFLSSVVIFASSLFSFDTTACKACHGSNFEKSALNTSKIVKDMNTTEIQSALIGYKNGTYGGKLKAIMINQVKKYKIQDLNITKEDLNITTSTRQHVNTKVLNEKTI